MEINRPLVPIMKLVVDTNQLQKDRLRKFLSESPRNAAVIPDFVSMEIYKPGTIEAVRSSVEVLRHFPTQVIVLKGSSVVKGLRGRVAGLQRRMIDTEQSLGFPLFIRELESAYQGHGGYARSVRSHSKAASEHMDVMLSEVDKMRSAALDLANQFTASEKRALRTEADLVPDLAAKIIRLTMHICAHAMRGPRWHVRVPEYKELRNTFVFRAALAQLLMMLKRDSKGKRPVIPPCVSTLTLLLGVPPMRQQFLDATRRLSG